MTSCPASPLESYDHLTATGRFTADPEQRKAVKALDRLWRVLSEPSRESSGLKRVWGRLAGKRHEAPQGIYLWGSVGRGKTWLMDLFYESLPIEAKRRVHFHRFMQRVHGELAELGAMADPLPLIARRWSHGTRLLCLDEFFVSDIADAMLLSGLLEALFERGVTLVTTSNIPPDDLYRSGLQRAKFLPAIERLKAHCEVVQIGGDADYRLRILERSETYHQPLDDQAEAVLAVNYEQIACGSELGSGLEVNGRMLHAKKRSDGVAWFDFSELCEGPRGAADYIELARAFNTVLISAVPVMTEKDWDAARRFITLVDEFYDRNVKLLMTAEAPIDALYTGDRLAFEFQRTRSRLTEMQSHDYLARPHLA
ncbi:MAG: cell division protein ZapE [Xanthomonadales bacterium]|nr:cell division protein ZapE [Xanthomonadales bacterium]